jgi:hypothetical protein
MDMCTAWQNTRHDDDEDDDDDDKELTEKGDLQDQDLHGTAMT